MHDRVPVRIGTRGSALAMVQASWVAGELEAAGVAVELVTIQTAGDVRAPDTAWGEGAFVGAIEAALLDGRIDAAVHSAKDVPTVEDAHLTIAAYTVRADPRDALVCRIRGTTLATLPQGSRVGTDSPRRTAFLRAVRPDLVVHPLAGNVDTRLRKLDAGQSDALVLAVAGLTRLGHGERIEEILPLDVAVPAPGQGALAIQVRADDARARDAFSLLDDPPTRYAVEAERYFLRATGGGCRSPIGCLGRVDGDEVVLLAAASRGISPDGIPSIARLSERGPILGRLDVAERLALSIVEARRPRALVTRPAEQAASLADALRQRGVGPVVVPTIEIHSVRAGGPLDDAVARLASYAWVVVTSVNGARSVVDAIERMSGAPTSTRWAAAGPGTTAALEAAGLTVTFAPSRSLGAALSVELPIEPGMRVLLARGDLADPGMARALVERGAVVDEVVAYETAEAPGRSMPALAASLEEGPFDALVFTSGSAVRGLLRLADPSWHAELRETLAVCIGPTTAGVARTEGFAHVVESPEGGAAGLAGAVADALGVADPLDGDDRALFSPAATGLQGPGLEGPGLEAAASSAVKMEGTR